MAERNAPIVDLDPGLVRPRLLTRLDAVRALRAGLVVGAAGAGKTTLLMHWLTAQAEPAVWVRCSPPLGEERPHLGVRALHGARVPRPAPSTLAGIADLFERRDPPRLLVVDDLHLLGPDAERGLADLVDALPPATRVLAATRNAPDAARPPRDPRVLVTFGDLRWRTWEVDALLRHSGIVLEPDDVEAVSRHTDGWSVALVLFARSVADELPAERRRAVRRLEHRHRYAWDYLATQVLAEVPVADQRFLHDVAPLRVVTAARADALRGEPGSLAVLRRLASTLGLVTTDDDVTFRVHDVLRRHLETDVTDELTTQGAHAWYARAAEVLEADGALGDALRARLRAADASGVLRVLAAGEQRGGLALPGPGPAGLDEDDPLVRRARARALLADGRFHDAARLWLDAGDRPTARAQPPWWGLLRDAITAAPRRAGETTGSVGVGQGPGLGAGVGVGTEVEVGERAPAAVRDVATGILRLLAGDHRGAAAPLQRAAADPDAGVSIGLVAHLASQVLLEPGTAASLVEVDRVQLTAERVGLPWIARIARGVVVGWDGDDAARQAAARVVEECERRDDVWGAAIVETTSLEARLRAGRASTREWAALAARFRALDAGTLEAWAEAFGALTAARSDDPAAAELARAAEASAREMDVPGARAVALTALARAEPSDVSESRAREAAREAGLAPSSPWLDDLPRAEPPRAETLGRHGADLEVRCFGTFEVRVDGHVVDLAPIRPLARTALRVLALQAGRPVHRETLANALWQRPASPRAMHNLHVHLSAVRRLLATADDVQLEREGASYVLRLAPTARCDVVDLEAVVRQGLRARDAQRWDAAESALRAALDLYRGDLLVEEGDAEWVLAPREQHRLRAATAADTLAEVLLARGDPRGAAGAASRSLELDPWRDLAWRHLVAALEAAGDVAAAEHARSEYRRVLGKLGVVSDDEVTGGRRTPPPRPTPEWAGRSRTSTRR